MTSVLLHAHKVSKAFPGVQALRDVSLSVRAGEIVALVGHNGSGKSTLVKVLAGVHRADSGSIVTPGGATGQGGLEGLHFIHQDLGLVPTLTTIENIDLGRPLRPRGLLPSPVTRERRQARAMIGRFDVEFDVDARVSALTPAERTIVAIARALDGWTTPENVLVLDEPTAALQGEEVGKLFEVIRRVASAGAGVVIISHRLDEVVELADRVVVLRDGRVVADSVRGEFDQASLVRLIAGQVVDTEVRPVGSVQEAAVRLAVQGLRAPRLDGVDLQVRAGEIVGVTGLLGSGMEQVAGVIFGSTTRTSGTVQVDGAVVAAHAPAASIKAGMGYVPADRRRLGGIALLNARENVTLPRLSPLRRRLGLIAKTEERAEARRWMDVVDVRPADASERPFALFSGGNQQKLILAKWLRNEPGVLLMEEPTQGVDVAAQAGIHELVTRIAAAGTGVLVSSTDTRELARLCSRVLVLHAGRVTKVLAGAALSESALVRATLEQPRPRTPENLHPRGGKAYG